MTNQGYSVHLDPIQRDLLAGMLTDFFDGGVFETLMVSEYQGISPSEDGYDGSTHREFNGPLSDWEWPE